MDNQLIQVTQLPIIEERLRDFKSEVDAKVQEAMSLVCTEETRSQVKAYRADLNKQFAELEAMRKAVKEQIMQPYMAFESIYKECVSDAMKSADADLKKKIDAVESGIKQDKREQLEAYFVECCVGYGVPEDMVSLDRLGVKVNLSTTVSSAKKRIADSLQRISGEIQYINDMDYADEIMVEYRKTLNPISAAQTVEDRYKRMEEERQRREADRKAAEMRVAAQAEVEQAIEDEPDFTDNFNGLDVIEIPVAEQLPENEFTHEEHVEHQAPAVTADTSVYTVKFSVTGTIDQLRRLKKYMEQEGLNYADI